MAEVILFNNAEDSIYEQGPCFNINLTYSWTPESHVVIHIFWKLQKRSERWSSTDSLDTHSVQRFFVLIIFPLPTTVNKNKT